MAAPDARTPRGSFQVNQRLLRGYGPLAVLAAMLVVMALLVPSKPQTASGNLDTTGVSGDDRESSSVTAGPDDTTGTTAAPGQVASGGGQTNAGKQIAAPTACDGKKDQVAGDPYSPPCVAFSGFNGGATHRGVNDKEIHVAFRVLNEKGFQQTLAELAGASLTDTPETIKNTVIALGEYFSKRYQFYGRKIVWDFYNGVGSNTTELLGGGRDKAQADAEKVKSMGSFADMSATSEPYADALASRGIVGFGDPYLSTPWHDRHRPYIWSLAVDGTTVAKLAAEYTVKRLHGPGGAVKPAKWAGGELKDKPRRVASMAPENSWYQESVQIAKGDIEKAGVKVVTNIEYQLDLGTMSNQANNLVPKLKDQGVTTILCGCDPVFPVFMTGAMNRERYFPEIIIVGTALTDADIVGQLFDQEAAKHMLGVSALEEPVPPTQTIAYEAFKTVRPGDEPAFSVDLIYFQMQMMAIGFQMAGPNLTPPNFEKGMFAYPSRLGPVGRWGFQTHDYTAADDVREIYWDPNATSNYNGKRGAYVDPQKGTRWLPGMIPTGDPAVPVR
ncbi:MAG TPA: ABC transporter substrate-binding protein [Acidimicrobiales bacterium]|nr:ABC transporter substrate-binding protein [Acidimicrobiales bacterium]